MDAAPQPSPEEIAALRAALALAEERGLQSGAELAVARAEASDDKALIAHQKLRIAKRERQLYGQRSERQAQLIDRWSWSSRSTRPAPAPTSSPRSWRRPRPPGSPPSSAAAPRRDHLPRAPAQGARAHRSAERV